VTDPAAFILSAPVLPSGILHAAAALFCLAWAVLIGFAARGRAASLLAVAPLAAALWLAAVALTPARPLDGPAGAAESLCSAAWFALLLAFYWRAGRAHVAGTVIRFGIVGGLLTLAGLAALTPGLGAAIMLPTLGSPVLLSRLAMAITIVVLAENLYRNADEAARWHVNLPCIALGGLAVLDILLYADAVLSRQFSPAFLDVRAVLTALAMPLLAIAAARGRRLRRRLRQAARSVGVDRRGRRGGRPARVQRPGPGWPGHDAVREDVLVARFRHGDRPLRHAVDGECGHPLRRPSAAFPLQGGRRQRSVQARPRRPRMACSAATRWPTHPTFEPP